MSKSIHIIIDKEGDIKTDLNGFSGDSCYAEAKKLTKILHGLGVSIDVQEIKPKQELETATQSARLHLGSN